MEAMQSNASQDESAAGDEPGGGLRHGVRKNLTKRSIYRLVVWSAVIVLVWFALRTLARVDWATVWSSLGKLSWWHVFVLLGLAAARQFLSSRPLALFVAGLRTHQAIANDLLGDLVATITPVPADIVARMALFRSWGIDVPLGMSGLVLNSVLFYVIRLTTPVVGAVLLWTVVNDDEAIGWLAIGSAAVGIAVLVVLCWAARSESSAHRVGMWLGTLAHRIRSSWPNGQEMAKTAAEFHSKVAQRWQKYWFRAFSNLALMVAVESTIMVVALRFVGVGSAEVPLTLVVAAFLSVYLLSAAPMRGLGLIEAAVAAIIIDHVPGVDSAGVVAGLVVWRITVHLVPLLAGIVPALLWRSSEKESQVKPSEAEPSTSA